MEPYYLKFGNKIVSVYSNNTIEIKDYHENTLSNNAQILKEYAANADITADDGFLTDDGIARKYVKGIAFNTTNITPNSYDISWDVSEIQDGTITAYAVGNEMDGYDVTIVADGEIYMPENSTSLFQFCGYNENLDEYIIDLSGLNASTAVNMTNAFCDFGYYSMTSLNLGTTFDTSNVTNMEGMFGRCGSNSMITLNLGDNFNTSNVTNMTSMFSGCGLKKMQVLNLKEKFNTINVTSMGSMFNSCGRESMTTLNLGEHFDTSNVTNMKFLFNECGYNALVELDLGNRFNTLSATEMRSMFLNCGANSMKKLHLGNAFEKVNNVRNMENLFIGCGLSTCKYYVASLKAQNWLLSLDTGHRRVNNWNEDFIEVKDDII